MKRKSSCGKKIFLIEHSKQSLNCSTFMVSPLLLHGLQCTMHKRAPSDFFRNTTSNVGGGGGVTDSFHKNPNFKDKLFKICI